MVFNKSSYSASSIYVKFGTATEPSLLIQYCRFLQFPLTVEFNF